MTPLDDFKNKLALATFGRERTFKECVCCGTTSINKTDFHDATSLKEFHISGLCQYCQDEFFNG